MSVLTVTNTFVLFGLDVTDSVEMPAASDVWDFIRSAGFPRNVHVQVHSTVRRGKNGMGVKSISRPTCWCGAIAAYVREASDASDAGFVCNDHTNDFFAGMHAIVA